jgi:hypothetical protein
MKVIPCEKGKHKKVRREEEIGKNEGMGERHRRAFDTCNWQSWQKFDLRFYMYLNECFSPKI